MPYNIHFGLLARNRFAIDVPRWVESQWCDAFILDGSSPCESPRVWSYSVNDGGWSEVSLNQD